MFDIMLERLRQGHRTSGFPRELPVLPDRMRGRPMLDASKCAPDCRQCAEVCPTNAIRRNVSLNMDKLKSAAPILKSFADDKKIQVVGGIYELRSGKVNLVS